MRRGFAPSSADPVSRHSTRPLVGSLNPAMMRNAVDLPQPDRPSSETNSPSRTSRLSRASATTPLAKIFPTPSSATTEAPVGGGGAAEGAEMVRDGLGGRSVVILQEIRWGDGSLRHLPERPDRAADGTTGRWDVVAGRGFALALIVAWPIGG